MADWDWGDPDGRGRGGVRSGNLNFDARGSNLSCSRDLYKRAQESRDQDRTSQSRKASRKRSSSKKNKKKERSRSRKKKKKRSSSSESSSDSRIKRIRNR